MAMASHMRPFKPHDSNPIQGGPPYRLVILGTCIGTYYGKSVESGTSTISFHEVELNDEWRERLSPLDNQFRGIDKFLIEVNYYTGGLMIRNAYNNNLLIEYHINLASALRSNR